MTLLLFPLSALNLFSQGVIIKSLPCVHCHADLQVVEDGLLAGVTFEGPQPQPQPQPPHTLVPYLLLPTPSK